MPKQKSSQAAATATAPTATAPAAPKPRVVLEKAEPADVAAYFAATGLSRKEIAAAAGVSTSVIATVQNPKGDRWSLKTFEAKKLLIDAAAVDAAAARQAANEAAAAESATEEAAG